MATFQELADEAFADLLKKHGRPVGLKAALRKSAGVSADVVKLKDRKKPRKRGGKKARNDSGRRGALQAAALRLESRARCPRCGPRRTLALPVSGAALGFGWRGSSAG